MRGGLFGLRGKAAPDITLRMMNGSEQKLSDSKGEVVVLDFFATWCPPCRASLPHLNKLSQKRDLVDKGELAVYAVNCGEGQDAVRSFMGRNNYSFTVAMDSDGQASQAYGVHGIPTTVVVGKDGIVKYVVAGYGPEIAEQIDGAVNDALQADK